MENKKNDKVTDTPSLLPYAHTVGSAIIRPIDEGKMKGLAMKAMHEQTEMQLTQIKEQVELLLSQAQKIHDRMYISEKIYLAECKFKPIISNIYYLYSKNETDQFLSMIAPNEWTNCPFQFEASVKLLADHTGEIIEKAAG
jgi:hypothetical protein